MAHSGGRIYIDTSVTPNIGISIADIQTVLGSPRYPGTDKEINDIGGLITYGDINLFSKYKPVRWNLQNPQGTHSSDWWEGQSGNCGIAPCRLGTGSTALSSLYNFSFDGAKNGWVYERPRGIASYSEWYRIKDFNGYRHDSLPWSGWTGASNVVRGSSAWFSLDDVVADWDSSSLEPVTPDSIYYGNIILQLGLTTTADLGDCYFGVAVFNSSGACVGAMTCQNKMGASPSSMFIDANWSCGFENISWNAGNYQAIPFFWITDTNQPMPSGWTSIQYGEIYTVPYTMPKTLKVVASDDPSVALVYLTGACGIDDESGSTVTIGFAPIIGINGTGTYTLQRVWVRLTATSGGDSYLYDTSNDADYTPATLSGDGNSWDLVDQPDGSSGLTNCLSQVTVQKLSSGANYNVNVYAQVVNHAGSVTSLSKDYIIS